MSQGAWIAGGDYRRVSGVVARFAETAVGKHPAPEGALRLGEGKAPPLKFIVGKHPAPEGALRPKIASTSPRTVSRSVSTRHQKVH